MTISLVATGAPVASGGGATLAAPSTLAGVAVGDMLLLWATAKLDTVTMPTLAGWTKTADVITGSGTAGVGTGAHRQALYQRVYDGTETASIILTTSPTSAAIGGVVQAWRSGTGAFAPITFTAGSDTTSNTTLFAPGAVALADTAGDVVELFVVMSANRSLSGTTMSATGATYGTVTERLDAGTANGNNIRLVLLDAPVTAGPANGVPSSTSTASGTTTGGILYARLREATAPAGAVTMASGSTLGAAPEPGVLVAAVTMSTSVVLAADGLAVQPAAVTLGSGQVLATGGILEHLASIVMTSASGLAVGGLVTHPAVVAMSSASTLNAAVSATRPAAVGMSSGSSLAAAPVVDHPVAVTMSGSSSLSAGGSSSTAAAAAMASGSSLAVAAAGTQTTAVALASGSVLAAGGSATHLGAVTIGIGSTLTAGATTPHDAAIELASSSSVTVQPVVTRPAAAVLSSGSALSLQSIILRSAAAAMSTGSSLEVGARVDQAAAVVMSSASDLTLAARQDAIAQLLLMASGSELTVGAEVKPPLTSGPSARFAGGPYVYRLALTGPYVAGLAITGPHLARLTLTGPEVR